VNLGNQQWIVLVSDFDTPSDFVQYAGRIVGVPNGITLPNQGQIDSITIQGITLYGYLRTSPGGFLEWVMAAAPNPNQVYIDSIPAGGSWTLTGSPGRQVYYEIGQALLGFGVTGQQLRPGLKNLHDAAVANYIAAVHAGTVPVPPGP
jgi:hypothetical protein